MGEHMTKIQHADKKAQQTQQQKDVGYGALFKIRQISSNKKTTSYSLLGSQCKNESMYINSNNNRGFTARCANRPLVK